MKTVGILGGGQLGWMLSESLVKFGARPLVLSDGLSPALDRVVGTWQGPWDDPVVLRAFTDACDLVTIEVEHVPAIALDIIGDKLLPHPDTVRLTQHRIREKRFLSDNNLPCAAFETAESREEAIDLAQTLTFPAIVKTALGGYDGRGQFRVDSPRAYLDALETLGPAIDEFGIVIEEPLDIEAEASVIVARGARGSAVFPVFENEHAHHILDLTALPSTLPDSVQARMIEMAIQAAEAMSAFGLLTTEFFLTRTPGREGGQPVDGYWIYFNEFAPRPHNSGHVTRNACTINQFDVLAQILLDIAPVQPALLEGSWMMGNLLSEFWAERSEPLDLPAAWAAEPRIVDVVFYGKPPTRLGRKMGHVVALADDLASARSAINRFRDKLDRR